MPESNCFLLQIVLLLLCNYLEKNPNYNCSHFNENIYVYCFFIRNAGMELMVGKNWNALFDVIITNARKPEFFHETRRPFRKINTNTGQLSWDRVTVFEKGCFYQEVVISLFIIFLGFIIYSLL